MPQKPNANHAPARLYMCNVEISESIISLSRPGLVCCTYPLVPMCMHSQFIGASTFETQRDTEPITISL